MKLTKTSGSEFGGLLWRHLTLQRKLQYRCTTTVHHVHNSPKKCLGKFTYCMTCGAHKLVHSEPFLDYLYDLWHCCQRYIATCWKKILYRCTSTFSRLNYYGSILFKSHSYLYEVVRTNFSADFWTFRNFWPQFREYCGAIQRQNENCVAPLKGRSLLEKYFKPHQNWSINRDAMIVRTMHPVERTARRIRAWQTPHFRTYMAGRALFDLPKLCTVVELVVPIIKGANHFSV